MIGRSTSHALSSSWPAQRSNTRVMVGFFWCYPLALAAIEAAAALTHPPVGLLLHGVLLFGLMLHSMLGRRDETRRLALALAPLPLVRMLALALPLMDVPPRAWYPLLALSLFGAAWVVVQQAGLSAARLGLDVRRRAFQLLMITGGPGLGAVQYALFPLPPLHIGAGSTLLLLGGSILLASFAEELLLRGLLQQTALPLMGQRALLYGAVIFAVLHIGYLSVPVVVFAFLVGLLFAWVVHLSGSLLGVALVHSTASITHLLVLPFLIDTVAHAASPPLWVNLLAVLTPGLILLLLALMAVSLGLVLLLLADLCASST
jgi:membrane protease YdiL (CAAX protease family)